MIEGINKVGNRYNASFKIGHILANLGDYDTPDQAAMAIRAVWLRVIPEHKFIAKMNLKQFGVADLRDLPLESAHVPMRRRRPRGRRRPRCILPWSKAALLGGRPSRLATDGPHVLPL